MQKYTVLLVTLLCFVFTTAETTQVHISVVQKGSVDNYLTMMSNENYQIIATKNPVENAVRATTVSVKDTESLFFVESFSHMQPKLKGEVVRLENIIVVQLPIPPTGHSHYPEKPALYMKHIPLSENEGAVTVKQMRTSGINPGDLFHFSAHNVNIDRNFLKQKLEELSGAVPVTVGGSTFRIEERRSDTGRLRARAYLTREFENIGFEVREHSYTQSWYQGTNLIAEKKGKNADKFLIISAHYDTVSTAGADDDGTGIIGILAIANALKDISLDYTLRVVCFDQEEIGLVGSQAYARDLNNSGELNNMIGLIQLEMMGYDRDTDGGFHVIDCNENTSANLSDTVIKTVIASKVKLTSVPACTNRSDHASFWRYNKPAIVISQNFFGGDSNPCYHRACDKVENIDYNYMQKITDSVAQTVRNLIASK
ncbi:M28 family metallopeptidase [Candidatus Uabimicrobium sp. HlEnr_7]|uniref:M28 family metallopeptidase n=1 Tax=Candidatus Uabimicrobium helgolandensis TaxID=3095367 RepID=UPI00355898B1